MNRRFTHGHGWIRPDHTIVQVSDPRRLYQQLLQDQPDRRTSLQVSDPAEWLLDLYTDGWIACVTHRGHSWFEHGVDHTCDGAHRHQLVGHLHHHGAPVEHACVLYQTSRYQLPERRRVFGTITTS